MNAEYYSEVPNARGMYKLIRLMMNFEEKTQLKLFIQL